jgi:glycerol kinase
MEIYANQYATLTECIAKSGISPEEIAGIGITNQRETTIIWDKDTGKPICNAIVWQCRRTADICDELISNGYSEYIQSTTGLKIDAYFSATKIKWILDNVEGARKMADEGKLLFGTVDTWLIWKLTEGKIHVTDVTNASRTMIFNINSGEWDEKLLELFNIPYSMLPKVCSSSEIYGYVDVMGASIPICGIAGDQQAALFGHCCFDTGEAKNTYGTGCFLLTHTGNKKIDSANGLITTIAATEKGRPLEYALEGSVFVGGAVIQWLRDELRVINQSKDCEEVALKVNDCGGVYLVPAFAGLGAPYWDMHARGTVTGLTRGTNINHIVRAALESIAYQSNDVLLAMAADIDYEMKELKVDGGASSNNFLMQFQSDISNINVVRPKVTEATAQGAAFLAGLAVGFFSNREELKAINRIKDVFYSSIDQSMRENLLDGWGKAIAACKKA